MRLLTCVLSLGFALGLLIMPLEPVHAGSTDSVANANAAGNANNFWRRLYAKGGINPASFPVIDDDLLFAHMPTWTSHQIQLDAAHRRTRGGGIRVAVLDGGFDPDHPSLIGNMSAVSYDVIDRDYDAYDSGNGIDDDNDGFIDNALGHGTFVAGQIAFVAPDAEIMAIRVRDDEGKGTTDELMRGLFFAWFQGVDVVNVSLSQEAQHAPHILDIIDMMYADGIAVVVSAGNDGLDEMSELGHRRTALTVAAVDGMDTLASFSNYSRDPNALLVAAPGVDLYGPMAGGQGTWSGTSFAAGLVSGTVALALAHYPGVSLDAVFRRICNTGATVYSEDGEMMPFRRINLSKVVR